MISRNNMNVASVSLALLSLAVGFAQPPSVTANVVTGGLGPMVSGLSGGFSGALSGAVDGFGLSGKAATSGNGLVPNLVGGVTGSLGGVVKPVMGLLGSLSGGLLNQNNVIGGALQSTLGGINGLAGSDGINLNMRLASGVLDGAATGLAAGLNGMSRANGIGAAYGPNAVLASGMGLRNNYKRQAMMSQQLANSASAATAAGGLLGNTVANAAASVGGAMLGQSAANAAATVGNGMLANSAAAATAGREMLGNSMANTAASMGNSVADAAASVGGAMLGQSAANAAATVGNGMLANSAAAATAGREMLGNSVANSAASSGGAMFDNSLANAAATVGNGMLTNSAAAATAGREVLGNSMANAGANAAAYASDASGYGYGSGSGLGATGAAAAAAAAEGTLAAANTVANSGIAGDAALQTVTGGIGNQLGRGAIAYDALRNAQAEAALAGSQMVAHGNNNAQSASLASNAYRQAKLAGDRDRVNIAGTIQNSARISDAAIATHDTATKAEDSLLGSELAVDSASTVLDSDAAYIPPVTNSLLRSLPYGRLGIRNIIPKPLTYPSPYLPDVWLNGKPVNYLNVPLSMYPWANGPNGVRSTLNQAYGIYNGQPFRPNNGLIVNEMIYEPGYAYMSASNINGPFPSSLLPILAEGQFEAQDELAMANLLRNQQLNGAGMATTYSGFGRLNQVPMITGSVSDANLMPTTTIGTTYPIGSALVIEPRDSYFQDYNDNASSRQNMDERQQ